MLEWECAHKGWWSYLDNSIRVRKSKVKAETEKHMEETSEGETNEYALSRDDALYQPKWIVGVN